MPLFNEHAETDCPIPLEDLARLYRADRAKLPEAVRGFSPAVKAQLAVFCYGRSHLREVGLLIAGSCEPEALSRFAGVMGQVLAAQCRGRISEFGKDGQRHNSARSRITLAKAAA